MPNGNSDGIEYTQSPEQQQVWGALAPLVDRMYGGYTGQPIDTGQTFEHTVELPGGWSWQEGVGDGGYGEGWVQGDPTTQTIDVPIYTLPSPVSDNAQNLWGIPSVPDAPQWGQDYQSYSQFYRNQGPSSTPHFGAIDTPEVSQGTYDVPTHPGLPTAPKPNTYQLPNVPMPTGNWFDSLDPQLREGMWSPYHEGANQMVEMMGGGAGSARGGYSGAAGAALGEFYENAAKDVAIQGWNMYAPQANTQYQDALGRNIYDANMSNNINTQYYNDKRNMLQNQWSAQLGANQFGAGASNTANMFNTTQDIDANKYYTGFNNSYLLGDWINKQDRVGTDYTNYLSGVQQGYSGDWNMWNEQARQASLPYDFLPGLMGGTYSNPVIPNGQMNPWPGMVAGGIGAGIGASATRTPQGAAAGYGIGSGMGNAYSSYYM